MIDLELSDREKLILTRWFIEQKETSEEFLERYNKSMQRWGDLLELSKNEERLWKKFLTTNAEDRVKARFSSEAGIKRRKRDEHKMQMLEVEKRFPPVTGRISVCLR